jgi:indole-3-glycerol phosphate synthase
MANMNILDTIVEQKRLEVLKRKRDYPLSSLASFESYRRKTNRIEFAIGDEKAGIIAEFKRKSPSRGLIHPDADPVEVASAYEAAGVSAMSILTDHSFFGGSLLDLKQVREACPRLVLLRKDFIIDSYQLHEASAYGADMILLIAAILERHEIEELAMEAASLGLNTLFEVHHQGEMEKYHKEIKFVGVNNRDLKTFKVDTGRSLELIGALPQGVVPVSESGLSDPEEIRRLSKAGYSLFLMGENFMKEKDPGAACGRFINLI